MLEELIIIKVVEVISSSTPTVRKKSTSLEITAFLCSVITPAEQNIKAKVTTTMALIKPEFRVGLLLEAGSDWHGSHQYSPLDLPAAFLLPNLAALRQRHDVLAGEFGQQGVL